jgi:hypothetical protein
MVEQKVKRSNAAAGSGVFWQTDKQRDDIFCRYAADSDIYRSVSLHEYFETEDKKEKR